MLWPCKCVFDGVGGGIFGKHSPQTNTYLGRAEHLNENDHAIFITATILFTYVIFIACSVRPFFYYNDHELRTTFCALLP